MKPTVTQNTFRKESFSFKNIDEQKTTIIGAINNRHNAFTNGIYFIDKKRMKCRQK